MCADRYRRFFIVRLRDHSTGLWQDGQRVELGDKRTSVHHRSL
jgi:hypothetical protein